jgi:hypothetical protein
MGRSISDETCHQQMIFAISSCHDNQQCIDKIIDFAHHHLMTKPCRNVSGAQQLMKPAFSAHLLEMKTPTNDATRQMALHAPIQYNNEMEGGKPVLIKMTLFGLYLIHYQPYLSILESF